MSGNHTPTPWRLIEEEERGARIVSEVQDVVIATVWPFMRAHGDLPALANAELIVTAVNSYASSQAEIERLRTVGQKLLDHWDENSGPEKRDEFEGVEYWSPAGRMVSTEFIAELRAALSGSKD